MQITLNHGYPDWIGRRGAFVGQAAGPAMYNTATKDVVQPFAFQTYIDSMSLGITLSGTYIVVFRPSAAGPRPTFKAVWYTLSGMTEVTNATVLSAETVIVTGFCGKF